MVGGIRTNLKLLRRILDDADFRAAHIDTGYLDRLLAAPAPVSPDAAPAAATDSAGVAAMAAGLFAAPAAAPTATRAQTPWQHDALRRGLRR
jgi:acetyl-CoA carboxylase biotin carboxylase subunit